MPDAVDIKEALSTHVVKAPTPPTGATKAERLVEAQAHIAADAEKAGGREKTTKIVTDPQFGHQVEETTLGIGMPQTVDPAKVTIARRGQTVCDTNDPGNIRVREGLKAQHTPETKAKKG